MVLNNLGAFCSICAGTTVVGGTGTAIYLNRQHIFPKNVSNSNETFNNGAQIRINNVDLLDNPTIVVDANVNNGDINDNMQSDAAQNDENVLSHKKQNINEGDLSMLADQIKKKENELKTINTKNGHNISHLDSVNQRFQENSSKLINVKSEIEKLSKEIEEMSDGFIKKDSEIEMSNKKDIVVLTNEEKEKITEWEQQKPIDDEEIKDKKNEKEKLIKEQNDLEEKIKNSQTKIDELKKEQNDLKNQFLEVSREVNQLKTTGRNLDSILSIQE